MIKHVVMWKFQEMGNGEKEKNIQKAGELLKALVPIIPQIKAFEFGSDINKSDAAYDAILITEFETLEDLSTYQNHPEHQKVSAFITMVRSDRKVVDYVM